MSNDIVLSARGIKKTFRQGSKDYEVLHGIDMDVRRGQFVSIMGPSGSGKSTLLHILGLMSSPCAADRMNVDGVETAGVDQSKLTELRRDRIGFVFQRFNLLAVLDAAANLSIALKLHRKRVDGQVDRLLEFVGLADRRHLKPGQMSIGEQQRLAFARGIIHEPAILLADEPTGNLDSENAEKLMELIDRTRKEFNQTIVMVTHDADLAARTDRTCHIKDGVMHDGTLD